VWYTIKQRRDKAYKTVKSVSRSIAKIYATVIGSIGGSAGRRSVFLRQQPLYKDIFDKFTVDELGVMSYKDIQLYQAADKVGVIDRMKQLLKLNPDFTCPIEFIRYEIFKVLDNETILGLSEEVMEEIASIKFVESKDVFVFPVKKINHIIMKHNIKEKIEGIIHK